MGFVAGGGVKVGVIEAFGGQTAPDGYLLCDGGEISRSLYSDLFAILGETYGAGDGATTFNLPNYSNARMVTSSDVAIKGNGGGIGVKAGNVSSTTLRARVNNSGDGAGDLYMASAPNSSSQVVYFVETNGGAGLIGSSTLASSCNYIIKY